MRFLRRRRKTKTKAARPRKMRAPRTPPAIAAGLEDGALDAAWSARGLGEAKADADAEGTEPGDPVIDGELDVDVVGPATVALEVANC